MTPKVLVCTPIVTGVSPKAYESHITMWKHVGRQSSYKARAMIVGPRKSPREIRNRAVYEMRKEDASHLFFLDDDVLPPKDVIDLLLQADKPIIGALIHKADGSPLVWEACNGGEKTYYGHPAAGVFPCHAVALGSMMVRRDVFNAIDEPWFFFERNGRTMDVNFCRMAQAVGIEVCCSADAACLQLVHEEKWI